MFNLTAVMYERMRALHETSGGPRSEPMRRDVTAQTSAWRRRSAPLLISAGIALWPAARQLVAVAPLFSALNLVITQ
jgi:hypothetical protein